MRILHITLDYRPTIGGIATYVENLHLFLNRRGIDSRILHIVEDSGRDGLEDEGTGVYHLHMKKNLRDYRKLTQAGRVRRVVERLNPDLLHLHTLNGPEYIFYRWKYPWVWTGHFSQLKSLLESTRPKDLIVKAVLKRLYMDARVLIGVSTTSAELISRLVEHPRIRVVPGGVDIDRFRPDEKDRREMREKLEVGGDDIVVFYPSRWAPVKGTHIMAQAIDHIAREMPSVFRKLVFLLTGRASAPVSYRREVEEKIPPDARVIIMDRIDPQDMPLYYRASDIVAVPSLFEMQGISVLEAMASAVPVVASKVGGITGILRDGMDGFLVEPGNPAELADKIIHLSESENLRRKMGEVARKRAMEFSWTRVAERMEEIYREASNFNLRER